MSKKMVIPHTIVRNCEHFGFTYEKLKAKEPAPVSIGHWANATSNWECLELYLNPDTRSKVIVVDSKGNVIKQEEKQKYYVAYEDHYYYKGKTYIAQGEVFPAIGDKHEAKRYKSKSRLENLIAKGSIPIYSSEWEIEEVKE